MIVHYNNVISRIYWHDVNQMKVYDTSVVPWTQFDCFLWQHNTIVWSGQFVFTGCLCPKYRQLPSSGNIQWLAHAHDVIQGHSQGLRCRTNDPSWIIAVLVLKLFRKKHQIYLKVIKMLLFFFRRKTVGKGHKHLGLQLASDLKWANHVNFIVSKEY